MYFSNYSSIFPASTAAAAAMFSFAAAHINYPCVEAPNKISQTHYTHTHTHTHTHQRETETSGQPRIRSFEAEATGGHFLTQLTLESIERKIFCWRPLAGGDQSIKVSPIFSLAYSLQMEHWRLVLLRCPEKRLRCLESLLTRLIIHDSLRRYLAFLSCLHTNRASIYLLIEPSSSLWFLLLLSYHNALYNNLIDRNWID